MDIRNVQKTGNMYYLYLPTAWCKEQNIKSGSKVSVDRRGSGKLLLSPGIIKKEAQHLEIDALVDDVDIINKLVVSCFINPTDSFKINLTKNMDYTQLLKQKRIVSVDMVELEGKTIKCESPVSVSNPDLVLKTMISKLTNMLMVMTSEYNNELIQRYEEEIDKSRLLIDKATISALTYTGPSKLKMIHLHYISLISKEIEHIADHLITLDEKNKGFFEKLLKKIQALKTIIELAIVDSESFDYVVAVRFAKEAAELSKEKIKEIHNSLDNITEVLLDWAITKKVM